VARARRSRARRRRGNERAQARLGGDQIAGPLQRARGGDRRFEAQVRLVARRFDGRQRRQRAFVVADERARLTEQHGGAQPRAASSPTAAGRPITASASARRRASGVNRVSAAATSAVRSWPSRLPTSLAAGWPPARALAARTISTASRGLPPEARCTAWAKPA